MKKTKKIVSKFAETLEESTSVAIFCHLKPDGDCLGSAFALKKTLERSGKRAYVYLEKWPSQLNFFQEFQNTEKENQIKEVDLVVVLDSPDFKRIEYRDILNEYKKKKKPILAIDHHKPGDLIEYVDLMWRDENTSSVCEMVLDLILEMDTKIDKELATFLLTGIESDTSSFQNQNTNENSLKAASFLVSKGAKLGRIIENTFEAKRVNLVKIYGLVLERIIYNRGHNVAVSYLRRRDLEKYGIEDTEVSGLANYLNRLKDVKAVILISEDGDGKLKVSMRTRNDNVDLSALARILGGGGHPKASGFEFWGNIVEKENKVFVT